MDRRRFILGSIVATVSSGCSGGGGGGSSDDANSGITSQATTAKCNLSTFPASAASINFSSFYQTAAQRQQQQLWCWAACIAMVFAYKGHPVSQTRIVTEAYGGPINMAGPGIVIAQALNRSWTDDFGKPFRSTMTGVYDFQAGVLAISNASIVDTLDRGTPMIIGTGNHARVLTEVDYIAGPAGPDIVGGQVFDPWFGQTQCLNYYDLFPAHVSGNLIFLASVSIS